ncbi:hypothetical protein V7x_16060 [Crateriforma conspicua]|uniref:Uncharacterized protein n=1 Tax=Crateriforma conspicua TaxID=2527996 RepID=A0A5C6FT35_9PLAN|nr:hypothetical protein V7x_16060 [Crateriforma conspicua]
MDGGQRQAGQESCGSDRVISSIAQPPNARREVRTGARWSKNFAEALKAPLSRCGGTFWSDAAYDSTSSSNTG